MPECRPQRGAFETWILCSGVEIGAFTGGAATGCGGPSRSNREKPNKYRYIPPAVVGMLEIAMRACQVSSESIRMSSRCVILRVTLALGPHFKIVAARNLEAPRRAFSNAHRNRHACATTWVRIADVGAYRTLVTPADRSSLRTCPSEERSLCTA